MSKTDYSTRLKIPLEGHISMPFYASNGDVIAIGYNRIVIGQRGPYIEFTEEQIAKDNIVIPSDQKYRLSVDYVFYNEYRSKDLTVKIYNQRKLVDYADYKIGYWYASAFSLITPAGSIIDPLK